MPTKLEVWAHPMSFSADPAREADRLAAAGITTVRLAHIYHSGRWLLTTSRPGAVADLPSGAWFSPGDYPRGGPTPMIAAPDAATAAPRASEALRAAGLSTIAWSVALHSTPLASMHPELAVVNAFGHPYRHALCPAQPAVRGYVTALVADLSARGVDGLDLEALGYLGWPHQGAHDKAEPLRAVDQWLLSLCFCTACIQLFDAAGIQVEELRRRVATAVEAQLTAPGVGPDPDAEACAVLGGDLRDAVHAVRDRVVVTLAAQAVSAANGTPVWLRASRDRYACAGKAAGDLATLAASGCGLTLTDFGGDGRALRRDVTAAGLPADRLTVGWSLIGQHTPDPETLTDLYAEIAADRLAFYAYDLAPPSRLEWLRSLTTDESEQPTWSR
jgi:hypothetical protein